MPAPNEVTVVADILQELLDVACVCLESTTLGAPADCFTYWCEPPDDCCDYLAVYPQGIRPTVGASSDIGDFNRVFGRCNDLTGRLDIQLKLMRECWPAPTQVGDTAALPPKPEMQTASEQLMIDMWVLWCCVLTEYSQGNLWNMGTHPTECLDVGWGEMTPKCPQGGCAGLYWDISIELPNCC